MIKSLRVRNLATIEDLEVNFEPGFSILTGETGAGKSILIDAIRLLLGEKADPDLVRTGKKDATVAAVFGAPAGRASEPDDLAAGGDGEVLVQRQITEEGTGKAYLNGVLVPLRRLKEAAPRLADVYGQNDHVFLLHIENHLAFLDAFIEADPLRAEVARAARELRARLEEKRELDERQRERQQRLDFIAFQVREIESAALRPGEDEELRREREIQRNAEKIAGLVEQALDLSYQQEEALVPRLAKLRNVIDQLAVYAPQLAAGRAALDQAAIEFAELAEALREFRGRQADAPANLERVEERLASIEKLERKYGATVADVLAHLERVKAEGTELGRNEERLADLETEIRTAFAAYADRAAKLTRLRQKGAVELQRLIEGEVAELGMKKARFAIQLTTRPPALEDPATIQDLGAETAEFMISPNPGEELRPLRRIASGGELSRTMLALKSVGKEREDLKTLIFDEIDAGIGGRTAEFIARKLRQLAGRHQVICITHLPQIAACAGQHYRIEKSVEKGRTFTSVAKLTPAERAEEVARLIAGSQVTEATLRIAREMIAAGAAGSWKKGG